MKHMDKDWIDVLQRLGFSMRFGSWEKQQAAQFQMREGRMHFVVRLKDEGDHVIARLSISQGRFNEQTDKFIPIADPGKLRAMIDKHKSLLTVASIRKFPHQFLQSKMYDAVRKSKRVVVRVLYTAGESHFREMVIGARGVVASTEMVDCFADLAPGKYTMLAKEWDEIKFLTKFI